MPQLLSLTARLVERTVPACLRSVAVLRRPIRCLQIMRQLVLQLHWSLGDRMPFV